jgi:hypothetical protein
MRRGEKMLEISSKKKKDSHMSMGMIIKYLNLSGNSVC